jgi:hypothetical protein
MRIPEIRQLWLEARPKYAAGASNEAQRNFLALMDVALDEAAPASDADATDADATDAPVRQVVARPPRRVRRRPSSVVAIGVGAAAGIVGVAVAKSLARPRR